MDKLDTSIPSSPSKQTRRRYSPEFRAELVNRCAEPDVSVASVARDYGINANLIHKWIRAAESKAQPIAAPVNFLPVPISPAVVPASVHFEFNGLSVDWPITHIDQALLWIREFQR